MQKKYGECLKYLEDYWKRITFYIPKNNKTFIGLPNKFVAPNNAIFKHDQFYWDSYFIILGLLKSNKISLAKGMVDNFIFLYKKYGIVPSRNRFYSLGIFCLLFRS